MGSVFVTQPDRTIKTIGNKEVAVPFYLQFVPGYVVEVVHSEKSLRYNGKNSINSIIALPHYTDKVYKTRASAGEEYRYYPLFRTMHDIPSKGDPILLCTIGKIKYYLGPLNTDNNSPTWNDDPSFRPELLLTNKAIGDVTPRGLKGESPNFNKKSYSRLTKVRKEQLDFGNAVNETTGDTIIEGRHGNSIRVGSRSNNPYVFISNKRNTDNIIESLDDGSLISISSDGTLSDHFPSFLRGEVEYFGFTLASDFVREEEEPPNRFMGKLVSDINNVDTQDLIYNYSDNQILISSERIIFNSKLDDIYISSNRDIHIGSKRNLTMSTSKIVVDSNETFLGNPTNREDSMESMVLGTTLLELLKEALAVIKSSQGVCQGAPIPLVDDTGTPNSVNAKITQIEQKIDQILSTKHFIEPNA